MLMKQHTLYIAALCLTSPFVSATQNTELPESGGNSFYRSIGKLSGNMTCTLSFVQFSDNLNAPATFLSNGHCSQNAFSSSASNDVTVGKAVNYTAKFNYFQDSIEAGETISVGINKVLYSTMKGVDISVLSSDQTVAQLIAQGLTPYRISQDSLPSETAITVAGVPIDVGALQLSHCESGDTFNVIEGYWHWYNFNENNCQGISSGSSGSPVFDNNQNMVGLINTTTNTAVGKTCYSGNPCAVDGEGAHVKKNKNYVVPIQDLKQCFNSSGTFALNSPGCPLPKSSNINIANYPYIFSGENSRYKQWKFTVNSESKIRYKNILLSDNTQTCQDLSGYSAPIDASQVNFSETKIDINKEGIHQYCIIGENDNASAPNVVQVQVDNTAPSTKPILNVTPIGFEPIFMVPEYSDYWLAWGNPDEIDCDDARYIQYRRNPIRIQSVPLKVCVYGFDAAGNQSPNFDYLIESPF